ncbi:MAG: aminotransferase class I/II-fold pyridoxal phosphate-dependent enzyme [Bacteroidales bacterium]|nr:aminotransferase class I/II-fold pyridoxal phosphate-dependent enzyme [Bacteroidales bacterium]
MQAIILAAGMGRRLGELTKDNTKCMLKVNGIRLIDRTLDCLSVLNLKRVVIVVGYNGDKVIDYVGNNYKGTEIVYVDNPIYDKTNNIYSLFLARDYMVEDDTLLLESDLIYEHSVIEKLLADPRPDLALVDKYESWMDGTVVTLDEEQNIVNFLNKEKFRYSDIADYYKTVNIYKFSREFSTGQYVPFLNAYCTALGRNEYYEQVLRVITLLGNTTLKALPLSGEKWYEIDDIQDLDIAEGMFAESEEAQWRAVTGRYGGYWRYPHMKDYCYLVNPYFPPQRLLDEIKASFDTIIREYPSGMSVNSLLAAKNFNLHQENIVVGNGAAELIKDLMEHTEGKIGVARPTFEEYPNRRSDEDVVWFTPKNADFHYSAGDLMSFYADKDISALLLINPDNPSGNYIPFEELMSLVEWTKERGMMLVYDESFMDFADLSYTMMRQELLDKNPHVVVVKSISKSYGVPGLRLGVLSSGNVELVSAIKKHVAIWNINSFAEFYMQIYEKYEKDYNEACRLFKNERTLFLQGLKEVPYLRVIPSEANYFLCEVTSRFTSRELAIRLMKDYNILIKDCATKRAFDGRNYIRLAIRDRNDNQMLVDALKKLI